MFNVQDQRKAMQMFLEVAEKNISELDHLMEILKFNHDTEVIHSAYVLSHSLKSEHYAMGFIRTAGICKSLEQLFASAHAENGLISNPQYQKMKELMNLIKDSFNRIKISGNEGEKQEPF